MLAVWLGLLVPWWLLLPVSAIAFEGSSPLRVYFFAWAMWSYPVSIGLAYLCRSKRPVLVLLPLGNVAVTVLASVLP